MIEVSFKTIGDKNCKTFTLLNDGFMPSGFVEMECRLSENYLNGDEAFFITVEDEDVAKNGNYSPLEMDKNELGQFIEFLQWCYNELPK